jgi:putative phosphoserine phosphatase/1-acylglycerol-3-phosphate O-acyltransferase
VAGRAAFFDLDRTLVRGASGPTITKALRQVGVVSQRSIPGENLVYQVYNLIGETRPSMALTRQAARLARGWVRSAVQEAGVIAASALEELVPTFARRLLDEHRADGELLVLTTTTPYDLVKPFADALGFDDVIATRYGEREGRFDGSIAGGFVWGRGKLDAVRTWAEEHGVSLEDSHAYSDSYYDAPLLSAVGHPHAVNPDPRLQLLALARR